ncbi:unnamed protein product [Rangifer tarandus platyrhynchus]|uniref:Uncharacterized protein n=2 Tax=Rangifer tarandus platyrhynchus TaxID=3082113 RepID=A0ACB0DQF8_RANTA|nr:unnamed protein product [Rangifer tarandus platyrhynchus]CAI9690477.1 unnamed protein product [Rangifer tarandus platyrhynchus]
MSVVHPLPFTGLNQMEEENSQLSPISTVFFFTIIIFIFFTIIIPNMESIYRSPTARAQGARPGPPRPALEKAYSRLGRHGLPGAGLAPGSKAGTRHFGDGNGRPPGRVQPRRGPEGHGPGGGDDRDPPRGRREPGIPQTQTLPGGSLPNRPPGPGHAGTPKRPTAKPGASKRPQGGPEPRPPPAPARQPAPRPPRAAWAASESPGHRRAEPSRAEPSERALPSRAEAGRAAQRSPDQPSAAQPGAAESRPPAGKQRAPAPRAPPRPGSREPGTPTRVSSPTGPQRGHPRERSARGDTSVPAFTLLSHTSAWHSLTRPLCPEQPRSPPRLSGVSLPDKAGQGTPSGTWRGGYSPEGNVPGNREGVATGRE